DVGFRFVQQHAITAWANDYRTQQTFRVEVETIIVPAAKWMEMRESADGRWSHSLVDGGLLIATQFRHPFLHRDGNEGKVQSHGESEHDPDRLQALQAFRGALFDFLEGR